MRLDMSQSFCWTFGLEFYGDFRLILQFQLKFTPFVESKNVVQSLVLALELVLKHIINFIKSADKLLWFL